MASSDPNKPRPCPRPPDSAAWPPSSSAKRTGFRPFFSGVTSDAREKGEGDGKEEDGVSAQCLQTLKRKILRISRDAPNQNIGSENFIQGTGEKSKPKHGSSVIGVVYKKTFFITADTRQTQIDRYGVKIVTPKETQSKVKKVGDVVMAFVGDNDMFTEACQFVQGNYSIKSFEDLAKDLYKELKDVPLIYPNQGIDLLMVRYNGAEFVARKVIVNLTTKDRIEDAGPKEITGGE